MNTTDGGSTGFGTVSLTAGATTNGAITDGNGGTVNVVADMAILTADTGIGTSADAVDTQITTLTATNTVSGDIYIEEADDLALDQVMNTTDGGTTGFGTVSLTAGATTDGAITDGNGGTVNIVSDTAILTADTGIGTNADAVDTQITTLTATNTVSGDIYIEEADDLALDQVMNTTDGGTTGFGTVSLTAGATTDGAITDGNGGTVNIVSDTAILTADTGIGTSADAVDTQITTLTATNTATGGIYIEEADDLALDQVMNTTDGGSTGFGTVSLTAGATTNGAITDGNGGTVNVVADMAILTADTGIGTSADAVDTQITTLTATNTVSGDIYIEETDNVALDLVSNDGRFVSLVAGGSITDGGDDTNVDVLANTAVLIADGSIGSGDSTDSDTNAKAVDIEVDFIEAQADTNIYLESVQAVTVGGASAGIASAGIAGLEGTAGVVKLKSAGTITVDEAVNAGGDVLLLTTVGDVTVGADVTAGGDLTIIAADNVNQKADLIANDNVSGGDAYVKALSGNIVMDADTQTQGDDIRYEASDGTNGTIALDLLSAVDSVSVVAGVDITDVRSDETANVVADRARLVATNGSIGDTNDADIDLDVTYVEAQAFDNVYLESVGAGAITVGGVDGVLTNYARFDSGTTEELDTDLIGLQAFNGIADLKSENSIIVTETIDADTDVILLVSTSGDITQNIAINTDSNVTITAAGNVYQNKDITTTGGMVTVTAQTGEIEMDNGTTTSSGGGTINYTANTNITLSVLDAGTGDVTVNAGSAIIDGLDDTDSVTPGEQGVNILANTANLTASSGIGVVDVFADGFNDIDTTITTLTATNSTSEDIYIEETDDVALDLVSNDGRFVSLMAGGSITDSGADTNVDVLANTVELIAGQSIGSGSGANDDANAAAVDLTVASVEAQAGTDIYLESSQAVNVGGVSGSLVGLEGTAGVVKLKSAGTITVDEAVEANTDVLLLTTSGDITQNAGATLTASNGNASVIAAGNVNQNATITSGGDTYVSALSGNVSMASGTQTTGDDIRYVASIGVSLGLLSATDSVSVDAGNNITDANSDETVNVSGTRARLVAGGSIGSGTATASDTNANALDIAVTNVEAQAGSDAYLQSTQALTLGGVGNVTTDYARFGSGTTTATDTDLTGLYGTAGVVKLKSAGTITVDEAVQAGTDILLTTAGNIDQNVNGFLTADSGRASVIAAGGVTQDADIQAGSDVYVEAKSGSIAMADGTATNSTSGNIRYAASAGVELSELTASAGEVSVLAQGGLITDISTVETANITALGARLEASDSIGAAGTTAASDTNANALDISVGNVEALAANNVYLESDQAVTVGGVDGVNYSYEYFASGEQSDSDTGLIGLEGKAGVVKLKSAGTITVDEAVQADTDILLLTSSGDITQSTGATLTSNNGSISVRSQGDVNQNANITTTNGTVDVEATNGSIVMSSGTETNSNGNNIRYIANSNITLGLLNADTGDVSVIADGGNITESESAETFPDPFQINSDPDNFSIYSDTNTTNIIASTVRLEAGGSIGTGTNEYQNSSDIGINPDLPPLVTPSAGALDLDVMTLSSSSGGNTFIFDSGDLLVDNSGSAITVNRVFFGSETLRVETDVELTQLGKAGGDYTLAVGGSLTLDNNGDPLVSDIETAGTQTYIYGLDYNPNQDTFDGYNLDNNDIPSLEFRNPGNESKFIFTDTYLESNTGDVFITANRLESLKPETNPLTDNIGFPATILYATNNGTENVKIEAGRDFIMGQYEKISIGPSVEAIDNTVAPSVDDPIILEIYAGRDGYLGDITSNGNVTIGLNGTLYIVERTPTPISNDNNGTLKIQDEGTDIAVNGVLDLLPEGRNNLTAILGTAGGSVGAVNVNIISIGWTDVDTQSDAGTLNNLAPSYIEVGRIPLNLFGSEPGFDSISQVFDVFENYPYVNRAELPEVAQQEEAISAALREELLKLRIFARNLTDAERLERREEDFVHIEQLIVDETAPISTYEVAVSRISTETAQRAVDYAKELMGDDPSSLEVMGETISAAFEEFLEANPDLEGLPDEFAQYVSTATTPIALAAYECADQLNQLLAMIAYMGITETELSISRRNILSRLKVRGLRGRELIEFFESFVLAGVTQVTLN